MENKFLEKKKESIIYLLDMETYICHSCKRTIYTNIKCPYCDCTVISEVDISTLYMYK